MLATDLATCMRLEDTFQQIWGLFRAHVAWCHSLQQLTNLSCWFFAGWIVTKTCSFMTDVNFFNFFCIICVHNKQKDLSYCIYSVYYYITWFCFLFLFVWLLTKIHVLVKYCQIFVGFLLYFFLQGIWHCLIFSSFMVLFQSTLCHAGKNYNFFVMEGHNIWVIFYDFWQEEL